MERRIASFGSDLLLWGIVAVALLLGQSEATRGLWHRTGHSDLHRDPYVVVLIVTLSFAVVAAVALGWTRWASWRRLTTAGALTYPFYLVHEHLGWFVIRVLHRFLGLPSAATLGATILVMLTLAWLIPRFVEKPFAPRSPRPRPPVLPRTGGRSRRRGVHRRRPRGGGRTSGGRGR